VRSTTYDPADAISEGLLAFETAADPPHRMATAVVAYRKMAVHFRSLMKPGDMCLLAFAGEVEREGSPRPCFVALLQDRVVLAWRVGMIGPRYRSDCVSYAAIGAITVDDSPGRPTGNIVITARGRLQTRVTPPAGSVELVEHTLRAAAFGEPASGPPDDPDADGR
jgi:hypothetical protein